MPETATQSKRPRRRLAKIMLALLLPGLLLGLLGYSQWPGHSRRSRADIRRAVDSISPIPTGAAGDRRDELAARTLAGIRRGLGYLKVHQEADGHFIKGALAPKASFTALVVIDFIKSPFRYRPREHPFLQKALAALAAAQRRSGVIYAFPTMSFSNYSTSLAVLALQATGDPRYKPMIDKAVAYLKSTQHRGGNAGVDAGGIGYNGDSRPDVNNTMSALEALNQSGIPKDDPAYKAAVAFISRAQNRPESNPQPWAAGDEDNKGGFIYRPAESPAGSFTDRTGQKRYASYGTMTYAGLVSFLYAHVDRDDPRVRSAWDWIQKHYDLHENVNMKDVGLFYYYRIMAKALAAYGERYVVTPDGKRHDWARDLAAHLLRLQQADGSWVNNNGKYFENDRVLVTAYVVRALSICYERMRKPGGQKPGAGVQP